MTTGFRSISPCSVIPLFIANNKQNFFAICELQMKKKCTQIFYSRICIKLHALCNLHAICVGKIPCHAHVMEARLREVMRAQLKIIIQNFAARKIIIIIGPAIKAKTKIDSSMKVSNELVGVPSSCIMISSH